MEELINMKRKIEDIENKRTDLASKRDEKINEANEIKDTNSNFYRLPMKEANDIQSEINELGKEAKSLKKEFDENLSIKKETEIKRLEYEKTRLDKIATVKREDRNKYIIELNTKKENIQKEIENKERYIEELKNRINRYNIKSEYDPWNQNLKHSKEDLKKKKESLKEYEIDLKCLSAKNPREEFKKIESRINTIKNLNYNNIEDVYAIEESETFIQENNEQNNEQSADITVNIKNNSIETSESENAEHGKSKITEQKKKYIEQIHNSINQNENKNLNKKETISQNEGKDEIENRNEIKNEALMDNLDNVSDLNINNKQSPSILNSSITDLQIKNHKTYNAVHEDMKKEVDKFYKMNKEYLDLNMDVEDLKDKYNISFDAALLLKSKMEIEGPRKEEVLNNTSISLWDKVKNKFSRHKKEDTKMLVERKASIFSRIRTAIKNKIIKPKLKEEQYNYDKEDYEEDYSFLESEENLEGSNKNNIGVDRLGNRTKKTEQEIQQDKKMEDERKSTNIDIPIEDGKHKDSDMEIV